MNKKFILFFLCYLSSAIVLAETLPKNAKIFCDINNNTCVAMGTIESTEMCPGGMYHCTNLASYISKDGQKNWIRTFTQDGDSLTRWDINAISCDKTMKNCATVGSHETGHSNLDSLSFILSTQDGGLNWFQKKQFTSLPCSSAMTYWQSLNDVTSTHFGKNWIAVGHCFSYDSNPMIGFTMISNDWGASWHYSKGQPKINHKMFDLLKVSCVDQDDTCYAHGKQDNKPVSFVTYNSGDDWQLEG